MLYSQSLVGATPLPAMAYGLEGVSDRTVPFLHCPTLAICEQDSSLLVHRTYNSGFYTRLLDDVIIV